MPDQGWLPRQSTEMRPAHVLFFAAVPPIEVVTQIARTWRLFGTGEPFRQDKLHLSIQAVSGVEILDPILVTRARQAASSLRAAQFTLCFDRLMTFNGRPDGKALVLATDKASDDLNILASELHISCRARGIGASRAAKVTPHMTLAYGPGFPESRMLDRPILWTIEEITLLDSLQGKGRHVPLGTWKLPKDRQQQSFDF